MTQKLYIQLVINIYQFEVVYLLYILILSEMFLRKKYFETVDKLFAQ